MFNSKSVRKVMGIGFLVLAMAILVLPGQLSAASKGKITVALSSDVGTLDPQNQIPRLALSPPNSILPIERREQPLSEFPL